ncbi:MAG: hypothetical protein JJE22_04725, partial [Bacteroidia bacterium]|nr:hypothetical protein [Bacteroidia bacterium]
MIFIEQMFEGEHRNNISPTNSVENEGKINFFNMAWKGFWFVVLVTSFQQLAGQTVMKVNDSILEYNFMPNELNFYVDTTNTFSFEKVSSPTFSNYFKSFPSYQNKDFKFGASYWIRIPIQHTTETNRIWLLEFYDQTIDFIDAYIPQENGSYKNIQMGDSQPFAQRTFRHKNFEIVLNMRSDTLMYYYFNVRSHEFADIRIAFRSVDRFVYYALNEYFLFGTF